MFVYSVGHQVVVEFKAYQDRLLEELFDVYSARDRRKTITFVFHARVLGQSVTASVTNTAILESDQNSVSVTALKLT